MDSLTWQQEALCLTVIYRMLEHGDKIPLYTEGTDYSFIEQTLDLLHNLNYLAISEDSSEWIPTDKAIDLRNNMLAIYDQLRHFEIYANVNLNQELAEDFAEPAQDQVFDHVYDPRFQVPEDPKALNPQDLRLAMIQFLAELEGRSIDENRSLYRFVFFQKLSNGDFNAPDVWFYFRSGIVFKDIAETVMSAYPWRSIANTEQNAIIAMQGIYTAGMLEQIKRAGYECVTCGIPLGVFEYNFKHDENTELKNCPNPECQASFDPPPSLDLACPNCQTPIRSTDDTCHGCGAFIDYLLPPGTIIDEKIEDEAPVIWHYTGESFSPSRGYNPYDPLIDMAGFSLLFMLLIN